eukprot:5987131-Pyramimonas_sp.AAC.1
MHVCTAFSTGEDPHHHRRPHRHHLHCPRDLSGPLYHCRRRHCSVFAPLAPPVLPLIPPRRPRAMPLADLLGARSQSIRGRGALHVQCEVLSARGSFGR